MSTRYKHMHFISATFIVDVVDIVCSSSSLLAYRYISQPKNNKILTTNGTFFERIYLLCMSHFKLNTRDIFQRISTRYVPTQASCQIGKTRSNHTFQSHIGTSTYIMRVLYGMALLSIFLYHQTYDDDTIYVRQNLLDY